LIYDLVRGVLSGLICCLLLPQFSVAQDCNADAGTLELVYNGDNEDGVICPGDNFSIRSNDDYVLPDGPAPALMYAIFSCPPDPTEPLDEDPCWTEYYWTGSDWTQFNDGSLQGIVDGNDVYVIAITVDDRRAPNHDSNGDGCYALGEGFYFNFLDEVEVSQLPDDNECDDVLRFEIYGVDDYFVNNLGPGSISQDGDEVTLSNLQDGDSYEFEVVPSNGCPPENVQGLFTQQTNFEDASFTFNSFCVTEVGRPTDIATPGGTFSFNPEPNDGAMIDPVTGEITDAVAGELYEVQYTTPGSFTTCPTTSIEPVVVTTRPVPPTISTDILFCADDIAIIRPRNSTGIFSLHEDFELTDPIQTDSSFDITSLLDPNNPLTFYVTAVQGNCQSTPITIEVRTVDANPPTVFENPIFACDGDAVTIDPTSSTGNNSSFNFYNDAQLDTLLRTGNDYTFPAQNRNQVYVTEIVSGCESEAILVNIENATPDPPMVDTLIRTCDGTSVTITPISTSGGSVFNFYSDSLLTSLLTTDSEYTFTAGGQSDIYVTETADNCESEAVRVRVITTLPNPPSAQDVATCINEPIPTLSAMGASNTFQWYDDDPDGQNLTPLATGASFTPSLDNTNQGEYSFWVTAVDEFGCESRSTLVNINIGAPPEAPTVDDPLPICAGQGLPVITADGTLSDFSWYENNPTNPGAVPVIIDDQFTPDIDNTVAGTYTFWVTQRDPQGCESVPASFDLVINAFAVAPDSDVRDTTFCVGETLPIFTASGGTGTISWYDEAPNSTTSPIDVGQLFEPPIDNTVGGTYTYWINTTTSEGCNSPAQSFTVTYETPLEAPTVDSLLGICTGDVLPTFTASGTGISLNWYDSNPVATPGATPIANGSSFTPSVDNTQPGTFSFWVTQTSANGCEGAPATAELVIQNILEAPDVNVPLPTCTGTAIPELFAAGEGTFFYWYDSDPATGNSASIYTGADFQPPIDSTSAGDYTFWVTQSETPGCESPAAIVTFTRVDAPLAPELAFQDTTICTGSEIPTLEALGSGGQLSWFDENPTGGTATPIAQDAIFTPGLDPAVASTSTFWVWEENSTGCISETAQVTVEIIAPPPPPSGATNTGICTGQTISTLTASGTGGNIRWYDEDPTTTTNPNFLAAGPAFTPDADNTTPASFTFWVTETNASGCESEPLAVSFLVSDTPQPPGQDTTLERCVGEAAPELSVTVATGLSVNWYDEDPSLNPSATPLTVNSTFTPPVNTNQAGSTVYFATISAPGGCVSMPTQYEITYAPIPPAPTITGPTEQCVGATTPTFEASTMGGEIAWFEEDPAQNPNAQPIVLGTTLVPSLNINEAGNFTFWAAEISANGCQSPATSFDFVIHPLPTATITSTCAADLNSYTITVESAANALTSTMGVITDNGNGNFSISDIPILETTTLELTNATTNCTAILEVTPPQCPCPDVAMPTSTGDVEICAGETIPPLEANAGAPNLEIDWYDAETGGNLLISNSTTFTPSAAGTFFAEARNTINGCVSARIPVLLTVNELPSLDNLQTTCADDLNSYTATITFDQPVDLQASAGTIIANGGESFEIINIPAETDINLTFTNTTTTCVNTFTITAPLCTCPTIAAPVSQGDLAICAGEMLPTLSVLGGTNIEIDWYDAETDGNLLLQNSTTYQPTTAGTYFAEARNTINACVSERTAVTLTINENPVLTIDNSVDPNCAGDNGSISLATTSGLAPFTYSTNGTSQSTSTFTDLAAANYEIAVADANGCVDTTETTLTLEDDLTAAATTDGVLTCIVNEVQLDGSTSDGTGTFSYEWRSNGQIIGNTPQVTATEAGDYQLVVTTENCSDSTSIMVEENRTEVNASIAEAEVLTCAVESVMLDGSASDNGAFITYQWQQNGQNLPDGQTTTFLATEPGVFDLLVTNTENGCSEMASVTVSVNRTLPEVAIAQEGVLNCMNSLATLDGSASTASGPLEFAWQNSDGTPLPNGTNSIVEITEPGNYVLEVTNTENGCTATNNITVIADRTPPNADAGPTQEIPCVDFSVILNGSNSDTGGNFTYEWTEVATGERFSKNLNPEVNNAGFYVLEVTNTNNGCTATDSVEVLPPTDVTTNFNFAIEPPSCFGEQNGAINISPTDASDTYLYSLDGAPFFNSNQFTGLASGSYEIAIQNSSGCEYDTLLVVDEGTDLTVELGSDIEIQLGDSLQLDAQLNVDTNSLRTLRWTNTQNLSCADCLNPMTRALKQTTSFDLFVEDVNGCIAEDNITIFVDRTRQIYIPNVFSPNGDGDNDVFMVFGGKDVLQIKSLQIYDRWGGKIFEATAFAPNDPAVSWDGTIPGNSTAASMSSNTFVYFVEAEFIDGEVEVFAGDVTLLR